MDDEWATLFICTQVTRATCISILYRPETDYPVVRNQQFFVWDWSILHA